MLYIVRLGKDPTILQRKQQQPQQIDDPQSASALMTVEKEKSLARTILREG